MLLCVGVTGSDGQQTVHYTDPIKQIALVSGLPHPTLAINPPSNLKVNI